jgi:phosphopantothenoylcysteine decarboxylase/phosphopantothenate--cysteine ligase
MPEPETIFEHIARMVHGDQSLKGLKVLVTAGGTREKIDPVRFISNHSSGRMGIALAEAASKRGANVSLVVGRIEVRPPSGVVTTTAQSVAEMHRAVAERISQADVVIMAAAPADFRPVSAADQKIKKGEAAPTIQLEPTEDILRSTIDSRKQGAIVVGFALETQDVLNNATKKLESKALDMIVANDATEPGAGFGVATNRVTLLTRGGGREDLPLMKKTEVAEVILDRIAKLIDERKG